MIAAGRGGMGADVRQTHAVVCGGWRAVGEMDGYRHARAVRQFIVRLRDPSVAYLQLRRCTTCC